MKRLLYVVAGAALAYAVGYIAVSLFAHWYEPRFIRSDDDIGIAFVWSLVVLVVFSVVGAVLGNKLYLSQETPPQ